MDELPLREMHLFAGAGGGILGGLLLGHVPVCAVEFSEYPRKVLLQRQRDGILPWFPVWDDVRTFDGKPWRGKVDVVCGGFPCQDISAAGKGAGIDGARSGLWSEMARIIGEVGPGIVFVENSPMLVSRGLGRVLGDLASLGYDAEWCVLGAVHAGAPHRRERIWIMAYPARIRTRKRAKRKQSGECGEQIAVCHTYNQGLEIGQSQSGNDGTQQPPTFRADWWQSEPGLGGVAHELASRLDGIETIGEGGV